MPSRQVEAVLRDMMHHIDLATHFSAGLDRASFKRDIKTVYAVTRCLEIISEASRRLPDVIKTRHPSICWKQMAAAGIVYRHDYEDVAAEFVWDTVETGVAAAAIGDRTGTQARRLNRSDEWKPCPAITIERPQILRPTRLDSNYPAG